MAFSMLVTVTMRLDCHSHKDQRQDAENQRLYCAKEQFQEIYAECQRGQQGGDHAEKDRAAEHGAEETEGERNHFRDLRDQLQDADEDIDEWHDDIEWA